VNSPPRARLKAAAARKDELEEIFQVLLQSPQLPELPQRMEGVLVTNGHTNPHVEPRMTGWFKEQRETHGRCVSFMHLDGLVDWVVESRLVNELLINSAV